MQGCTVLSELLGCLDDSDTFIPHWQCVVWSCRCISEILYIFKDVHGTAWLQNRWLYSKEEVQDALPKKS